VNLSERVRKLDFLLRGRVAGSIFTHAILIWVGLLVLIRSGNPLEGFVAAALVGLSWEFSYHSRWPIVDTLMSQFIALEMLCLAAAFKYKKHAALWIQLAVVSAALACGSKYPGGLGLVPAIGAAFTLCRMRAFRFILFLVQLVALFTIIFLLTTPGAIFEPSVFLKEVQRALAGESDKRYFMQIWHRRSGKDKTNIADIVPKRLLANPTLVKYVYPTLVMGRDNLWEGIVQYVG